MTPPNPTNTQAWRLWAEKLLKDLSPTPNLDAEILLVHGTGHSKTHLICYPEETLSTETLEHLSLLLAKRLDGDPIAYITGNREFWSLDIKVNSDCLIPRPETELMVEWALGIIPKQDCRNILDLGTGSGAIALAIASERPNCRIIAIDQSAKCIDLAHHNSKLLGITNVKWIQSNWFESISPDEAFDLIVTNPPYVAENDPNLFSGDVRKEPYEALVSGPDGLQDIRKIVKQAPAYMSTNGALGIEHGFEQGVQVKKILKNSGFHNVTTLQDLSGHDRVSIGTI